MINFISHLRPINLALIAITQFLIYFKFHPTINLDSGALNSVFHFSMLVMSTCLIAASGNIINDYFDFNIDSINKPKKQKLSRKQLINLYFILISLGFAISLYLAFQMDKVHYMSIYIIAGLSLFLYSYSWKGKGLPGNFIVSLFSAGVLGIVWFAFSPSFNTNAEISNILIFMMGLIFLSSMAREIVKDCQDIEGDRQQNLKTLPISIGPEKAKFFAAQFVLAIIVSCILWASQLDSFQYSISQILLGVVTILSLVIFIDILSSKTTSSFKRNATELKILMLIGLIYFYFA